MFKSLNKEASECTIEAGLSAAGEVDEECAEDEEPTVDLAIHCMNNFNSTFVWYLLEFNCDLGLKYHEKALQDMGPGCLP